MSTLTPPAVSRRPLSGAANSRRLWLGGAIAVVGLLTLVILALVVYPGLNTVVSTFAPGGHLTAAPFRSLFGSRGITTIIVNTVIYAVATVAVALAIGTGFAWLNERTDAHMGWLSGLLPILPLTVPPLGASIGYVMVFSPHSGAVNVFLRWLLDSHASTGPISILNFPGLILATAISIAPMAYFVVSAALRNADPALDEASRIAGAARMKTMLRVTLPAIRPALFSAGLMLLIEALGRFVEPYVIGTPAGITTASVYIFRLFSTYPPDEASAVTMSLLLMVPVGIAMLMERRMAVSVRRSVVGGRASARTVFALGPWRWVARALICAYVVVIFIPFIGLIEGSLLPFAGASFSSMSLSNFHATLSDSTAVSAVRNSLLLAAIGAAIVMMAAVILVGIAPYLVRRAGVLIDATITAPAVIPPVVLAVAFLVAFSGAPFNLYGTLTLVLLAYVTMFIPYGARAVRAALSQTGQDLIESSRVCGASPGRTAYKVVLPQVANGLVAGWAIVFLYLINESTASSFLGGLGVPVFGQVVLQDYGQGSIGEVSVLTLVVTVITAVIVLALRRAVAGATGTSAPGR